MRTIKRHPASPSLRAVAMGGAAMAIALAWGGSALAQTTPPQSVPASPAVQEPEDEAASVDDIVVTGTSIRGIRPVGSATVPLSREDIQATGLTSTADVVRTLPQLQNIGIDETRNAGSQDAATNSGRGTALNLRGLGANATLMLVDGRRIAPSGTVSAFGDPNQIPIAAIERIEVVTDGASAIYGTDAVGGVVNFIVRKNFDGAEITGRYSTTDGYDQAGLSAVLGKTWSNGNLVIAYDHDDREAMLRGTSPYLRQDLTRFGGNDGRINGATVSARVPVVVTQGGGVIRYFSAPDNRTNAPLTAADMIPGADVVDSADFTDYLPHRTRDSLTAFANLDLTDNISLYYQGFFNRRDSEQRSYRVESLTVPASNPYYISGLPGVAPGQSITVRYPWFKDFGRRYLIATERSFSNTFGTTVDLGSDWQLDAYATYAIAENCQCEEGPSAGIVNTTALNAMLAAGDPSFNPFSPDPISDAVRARVLGENLQRNKTILTDIVLKMDGPVMNLASGEVRGALGAEFLKVEGEYRNAGTTTNIDNQFRATYSGDKTREVNSLFGELFIPLVAESSNVPFVQRLDLSLAARYEHYSDFGDTTNPKVGLTWEVNDELLVRGTWGKSFRAPSLQENNEDVVTTFIATAYSNGSGDPLIPVTNAITGTSNVLVRVQGGNNDLGPERATTYSLGFDYSPHWLDGFRVSATYYNIEYAGKIVTLGEQASTFLTTAANRAAFDAYITPAPQPSTCVEGDPSTYNPVYVPFVTAGYPIPFTGTPFCSVVAYLNGQAQNLGRVEQDGLDFTVGHDLDTAWGQFSSGVSLTKILNLKQTLSPSSGLIDVLDTINNPVSTRVRGNLGWRGGSVSANLFVNYVGEYMNTAPITVAGVRQPVTEIPSWTTFDASLSWFTAEEAPSWAQGIRASLSIQNILDEDPNVVLTGANGFDNQQANPYGRIYSFELTKRF
ncbi:MAG: TonB-dependent receptor [Pseudomonadota bacterium]|nr:TonB-dependent receptor [Pseudomonadota bacterium]